MRLGRQTWRRVSAEPVGTSLAVLTLAVCIGLTTAAFSLFESAVRQPLPVPHPERLIRIIGAAIPRGMSAESWFGRAPSLQSTASFRLGRGTARINGQDGSLYVAEVSDGFFQVMGFAPALGRFIGGNVGGPREAVIGYGLWQQYFGRDPEVLGKFVSIGTVDFVVVAVAPARFTFPGETEVWVPRPDSNRFVVDLDMNEVAGGSFPVPSGLVARLGADANIEQVTAQLSGLQREHERTHLASGIEPSIVRVSDLRTSLAAPSRATILVFLAASLALLIAGAASFAHFVTVRTLARREEFALRRSFGARPFQLYRLVLLENALLAAASLAGGVVLAWAVLRVLSSLLPTTVPNARMLSVEGEALAVATALLVMIVGSVSGLGIRERPYETRVPLVRDRQGAVTSRLSRRMHDCLLVVQWSASLVLLSAALLFILSLQKLQEVDLGFDPEHVLAAEVRLPGDRADPTGQSVAWQHLMSMLESQPGIEAVALTDRIPLASQRPARRHVRSGDREAFAVARAVSSRYFDTLSIRMMAGGGFGPGPAGSCALCAVVNEAAAILLGAPPGALEWTLELEGAPYTVTGIVRNSAEGEADENAIPIVYLPLAKAQDTDALFVLLKGHTLPPISSRLTALARSVDPAGTVSRVRAMGDVVAGVYGPSRLRAFVLLTLALAATLVVGLGAFASVSLTVSQATRDLAIRRALGATPAALVRHVVGTVAKPLGLALPIGSGLAVMFASGMRGLLYGVGATDATSLGGAAGILILAVAVAIIAPVRRALRTNAAASLRTG